MTQPRLKPRFPTRETCLTTSRPRNVGWESTCFLGFQYCFLGVWCDGPVIVRAWCATHASGRRVASRIVWASRPRFYDVSFLDVIFLKEFWFVIFEYVILGCVISGSVVFNILFPNSFASEFDSSWFI